MGWSRRAARVSDAWSSAMMKFEDLRATMDRLNVLRGEYGRTDEPSEFQAVCVDWFGLSGYREQEQIASDSAIRSGRRKDAIKMFADEVIGKF